MDHLVVQTVVLQILNQFRGFSDASHADRAIKMLEGFVDFSRSQGSGEEDLEKWKIMAEAKAVQKKSDLQMMRWNCCIGLKPG